MTMPTTAIELAQMCNVKPSDVYDALKRLRKGEAIKGGKALVVAQRLQALGLAPDHFSPRTRAAAAAQVKPFPPASAALVAAREALLSDNADMAPTPLPAAPAPTAEAPSAKADMIGLMVDTLDRVAQQQRQTWPPCPWSSWWQRCAAARPGLSLFPFCEVMEPW